MDKYLKNKDYFQNFWASCGIFLKISYNLSQHMVKFNYGFRSKEILTEEFKMSDFVQRLSDTIETAKQSLGAPPAQLAPQRAATALDVVRRMATKNTAQPH